MKFFPHDCYHMLSRELPEHLTSHLHSWQEEERTGRPSKLSSNPCPIYQGNKTFPRSLTPRGFLLVGQSYIIWLLLPSRKTGNVCIWLSDYCDQPGESWCSQKRSSFISKVEKAKRVKMAAEWSMNRAFSVLLFSFSILMKKLKFSFCCYREAEIWLLFFYAEFF